MPHHGIRLIHLFSKLIIFAKSGQGRSFARCALSRRRQAQGQGRVAHGALFDVAAYPEIGPVTHTLIKVRFAPKATTRQTDWEVRSGSQTEARVHSRHVRFTLGSRHPSTPSGCRLCANSRHPRHCFPLMPPSFLHSGWTPRSHARDPARDVGTESLVLSSKRLLKRGLFVRHDE